MRPSPPPGFFNLTIIIMLYYIFTTVAANMEEYGAVLRESGPRFGRMLAGIPDMLPPLALAYGTCYIVFFLEYLVARRWLSSRVCFWSSQVVQWAMLISMMVYALHPSTVNWPVSQKGAFVVQIAVLLMKIHS